MPLNVIETLNLTENQTTESELRKNPEIMSEIQVNIPFIIYVTTYFLLSS